MNLILLQHVVGFVRDDPLLIGGNNEDGDSARRGADLLVVARVSGGVDRNSKPCQSITYCGTDLRLVLADTRREYDGIKTAERRRQARNLAGNPKAKYVDRFTRFGAITRQKLAAVWANPR